MLVRNIHDEPRAPVTMPGAAGATMALMVGRADGAPTCSLRSFEVEAGGHTPRHHHDYEHEVFVVSGSGTVHLSGEDRALRAGDVLLVPANEEHQFMADGGERLSFLCIVPVTRMCGEATPGS